jgi:hypothetical protein
MTIQVLNFNKSKAVLQEQLQSDPSKVNFYDPSIFSGTREDFTGADIPPGDSFAVVMDHPKRTRFAQVICNKDGSFKVL